MKKAVIFSSWFEPPMEFVEFCNSIGCSFSRVVFSDSGITFDPRIVEFCEKYAEGRAGEKVYKGRKTAQYKCGFAGGGYIREIDTAKRWRLAYNNCDAPEIEYIDVRTNEYGFTKVVPMPTKN